MKREKDSEILSALLDGEASEREVQRVLAQAHDSDLLEQFFALQRLQDLQHEARADWAGVDLRAGIGARLTADSSGLKEPGTHQQHKAQASRGEEFQTSISRRVPAGNRKLWSQVAVAAGVMSLSLLLFEALPGPTQLPSPDQQVDNAASGSRLSTVSEVPVSLDAPRSDAHVLLQSSDYRARLDGLLRQHAEEAATQSADMLGLLRLSRLPAEPALEDGEP